MKDREIVELALSKTHFLKFSEHIAKEFNFDVAVLLAFFIESEAYFEKRPKLVEFLNKSKGYFYCMAKYVQSRTGMSPDRMRRTVSKMEEAGIVSTKKWAKNWKLYKINHKVVASILIEGATGKLENRMDMNYYFDDQVDSLIDITDKIQNM